MIQFRVDESKRDAAAKAYRKHSPGNAWFLPLVVCAAVWLIASVFVMNALVPSEFQGMGPAAGSIRVVIVACLVLLLGGVPLLLVLSLRRGVVVEPIKGRKHERLLLTDEGIERAFAYAVYRNNRDTESLVYSYDAIPYTSITRIELYEDVQALKVYGTVYICDRPGAPTEESIRKVIDDPDKAYRVFFLYYHDADKLVQLISDRSGKPVTRLQHCTGSLQEVK